MRIEAWTQTIAALTLSSLLLGCPKNADDSAGTSPVKSTTETAPTPKKDDFLARGTVVETFNGKGYTYVHVDAGEVKVWAAAPRTQVAVGDVVELPAGMIMRGFTSTSVGRTFDTIYFIESIKLRKATGTLLAVGEVLKRREELAGVYVAVRGKVTQVTTQVMGMTWIHIQDEQGDELVVSTRRGVVKGSLVIAEGILRLDRDLGSGYKFPTLIEDAKVGILPANHPIGTDAARRPGGIPLPPTSQPTEPAAIDSSQPAGGSKPPAPPAEEPTEK